MRRKKKNMLGGGYVAPRLLTLGGMASTIADETDLATYFTFSSSEVTSFAHVSGNVEAYIKNPSYNVANSAFLNNTNITFITESGGYMTACTGNSGFQGATNLASLSLPGCLTVGFQVFFNCTNLDVDNISLPELTSINGANAFRGVNSSITGGVFSLPKLTTVAGAWSLRSMSVTEFDFPELLTVTTNSVWYETGGTPHINMPKCTQLGTTVDSAAPLMDSVFYLISGSAEITVDSSMETVNSGSPDTDLDYASGRGVTINYV